MSNVFLRIRIPQVETPGLDMSMIRCIGKYGPHRDPEVRDRILGATRQILAAEGPGGASVGAIARAAGAGKQTIYRWWPSRNALVADALEEIFEARSAFRVTDDPAADLRTQMVGVARLMRSPAGAMLRELVAEAQTDPDALELFRNRFFDRRRKFAADAIRRGVDSGQFRSDLDVTATIDSLYAPLWLRLLVGHAALTPAAVTSIADTVTRGLSPH